MLHMMPNRAHPYQTSLRLPSMACRHVMLSMRAKRAYNHGSHTHDAAEIETPMATQHTPPVLTELKLSPALKETVNTALARGRMMSVAYVSPEGRPELSFRGSVQAYSDTQLAIWVRNPAGGILAAVASGHPDIALLYGELGAESKAFVTFRGRARVDSSEPVRRKVYEDSPEAERNLDRDRKGVALIIDLDSVDGFFGGSVLKMRRG